MNALKQSSERSRELFDIKNVFPFFRFNDVLIQQPLAPLIHNIMPKLLARSSKYNMLEKWEYRPDYCSYEIYGTTNLYWLILYVNGCPSSLEFTKQRYNFIIAPSIEDVAELCIYTNINIRQI